MIYGWGVTSVFYYVLYTVEQNTVHLSCYLNVFMPHLQVNLDVFTQGWGNHPIRTEPNIIPNQLWGVGQIENPVVNPEEIIKQ